MVEVSEYPLDLFQSRVLEQIDNREAMINPNPKGFANHRFSETLIREYDFSKYEILASVNKQNRNIIQTFRDAVNTRIITTAGFESVRSIEAFEKKVIYSAAPDIFLGFDWNKPPLQENPELNAFFRDLAVRYCNYDNLKKIAKWPVEGIDPAILPEIFTIVNHNNFQNPIYTAAEVIAGFAKAVNMGIDVSTLLTFVNQEGMNTFYTDDMLAPALEEFWQQFPKGEQQGVFEFISIISRTLEATCEYISTLLSLVDGFSHAVVGDLHANIVNSMITHSRLINTTLRKLSTAGGYTLLRGDLNYNISS